MHTHRTQSDQDTAQNPQNAVQLQAENEHQSPQGKKGAIQAKQRPVQRMQGYQAHQAKHQPVQRKTNNTRLTNHLKSGVENPSRHSMNDVKVHYNSDKPVQLQAHTYAQGTDIHLASGQEKQRRLQPTTQFKSNINDGLEQEADIMGSKALNIGNTPVTPLISNNMSNTQAPIQRKIGDDENVIFGLDGKDKEAITNALDVGYTTFDAADSYGNTITLLAEILSEKKVERGDIDIIYKVATTPPTELQQHLRDIAEKFGGFIDQVLIHKVTETDRAKAYNPILTTLKKEGIIKAIGAGDVQADMNDYFEKNDSFEVNATELFAGPNHETLVKNLNESDKPVFVYNIVSTLKNFLKMGQGVFPNQIQIQAMVGKIKELIPKAEPILSSSKKSAQTANFNVFEIEDYEGVGNARKKIEEAASQDIEAPSINKMSEEVAKQLRGFITEHQWADEKLFDANEEYGKAKEEKLKLFSKQELEVVYQGVLEDTAKRFSLEQLINMLYESSGNCRRVEAATFLSNGLALMSQPSRHDENDSLDFGSDYTADNDIKNYEGDKRGKRGASDEADTSPARKKREPPSLSGK